VNQKTQSHHDVAIEDAVDVPVRHARAGRQRRREEQALKTLVAMMLNLAQSELTFVRLGSREEYAAVHAW